MGAMLSIYAEYFFCNFLLMPSDECNFPRYMKVRKFIAGSCAIFCQGKREQGQASVNKKLLSWGLPEDVCRDALNPGMTPCSPADLIMSARSTICMLVSILTYLRRVHI